jgi:hypothetical protein
LVEKVGTGAKKRREKTLMTQTGSTPPQASYLDPDFAVYHHTMYTLNPTTAHLTRTTGPIFTFNNDSRRPNIILKALRHNLLMKMKNMVISPRRESIILFRYLLRCLLMQNHCLDIGMMLNRESVMFGSWAQMHAWC